MKLWPFFTYYGGKWRIAPKYPAPKYSTIIEPFCGSAGYSLRYPNKQIELFDINPVITEVWKYIINVSESEILALPEHVEHVDKLDICEEARWLIGFWLNKGCVAPMKSPSRWMRDNIRPNSMWGAAIKKRIANQLQYIRHWKIDRQPYSLLENKKATWFVDPPYNDAMGKHYVFNKIDYKHLAYWCQQLNGQAIVCEREGSNWLPFKPFTISKGLEGKHGKKKINEAVWINEINDHQ